MTRVHGLQHVEGLAASDLPCDDSVRSHPERVAHQVTHRDLASALDVRRSGSERDDVRLREPKLGRILDRDQPLFVGDEPPQHAEQRRPAAPGASIAWSIGRMIVHSIPKRPAAIPEKKTVTASVHSSLVMGIPLPAD